MWLRLPQSANIVSDFEVMDECFTEMEHHLAAEQEKVKDSWVVIPTNTMHSTLFLLALSESVPGAGELNSSCARRCVVWPGQVGTLPVGIELGKRVEGF